MADGTGRPPGTVMGFCQGVNEAMGAMKFSKFSQSTGFTEAKMEAEEENGGLAAWIAACGFETAPIIDDGKKKNYRFTVHARKTSAKQSNYQYMAIIHDPAFTQKVLVQTQADLLALRLMVAPLLLIVT